MGRTSIEGDAAMADATAVAEEPAVAAVDDVSDVGDGDAADEDGSDGGSSLSGGVAEERPANLFGIADGHGKEGALVAQLTAQLFPAMLQRNIRKEFTAAAAVAPASSASPAASATAKVGAALAAASPPSMDTAVPASASSPASLQSPQQPHMSSASTVAATPRSQRTTLPSPLPAHPGAAAGAALSPLQQALASSGMPPLHTGASTSPLLSPGVMSVAPSVSAVVPASASPAAAARVPSPTQGGPPGSEAVDGPVAHVLSEAAAAADPVCRALTNTFLQVDAHVLAGKHVGGSTCTTAYVFQQPEAAASTPQRQAVTAPPVAPPPAPATLYVAHVGDSRCVLSRAGQALPLSSDHKPHRPDERRRVEAAGGNVVYYSGWRVDGQLNISRAIGDASLKAPPESFTASVVDGAGGAGASTSATTAERDSRSGRVIAVPEISRLPLSQEDEFIIVASDGVWGRLGNQQAVDIVRGVLLGSGAGPDAADEVADAAQAGEQDAGDQLPPLPRPSLAHDHSLVRPSSSALPLAANPVQSTLAAGAAAPVAAPVLNSMGSVVSMSTSASGAAVLGSPPPLHPAGPHTPLRTAVPANAPARSSLFSPRMAAAPFAATPSSTATSISRSLLGDSSASSVSGASGLLTGRSSTRLTSPTAALRLTHQDSVQSHADVDTVPAGQATDVAMAAAADPAAIASEDAARTKVAAPAAVASSEFVAPAEPSPYPCCWTSLRSRPELVSQASEALLHHAFEQGQSYDNLSAVVLLLYPFQHAAPHCEP